MTAMPIVTFGPLLKHFRQAAGLTQEALADRAHLSVRGIQNLERGVSQTPRRDTAGLLATALGLSAEDCASLLAAARPPPVSSAPPARAVPHATDSLVPLVGRRQELALLDRFLAGDLAVSGPVPMLLLAGEPGMGKTRLLQAAAQQAIAQGWSVLVGGCHRRGGQEPYAPLLEALGQHLHAADPPQLRAALVGCAWLVRLLPELAGALDPLPAGLLAPEQERRLLFAAVARLLTNVAGPAGTLLLLDDLQWAGADALDLLATLVRAGTSPLRLVGAYRGTEVRPTDPLGLLLADLAQARLVRQHTLGPLAAEDAAALLDDLLVDVAVRDRGTAERVLHRSGGTPFFLVSYAQALHQGGAEDVPWDLAQGVRQRVALLPAAGQEILGAAAVVGRRVPRTLLAAAAGQPEDAVLAGLEAACRARLLLEDGDDAYAFSHDVIREVVEADVGAARRAVLHRNVAEALEREPAGTSAELLAYHYTRAGRDGRALPYLEQAGDLAWASRAHGAAEGHYRALLDRLDMPGRAPEAVRAREKLAEVLYRAGRYEAVTQVLEPAAETLHAAGEWASLARVTARIGWAYAYRGRSGEGLTRIQPVLESLERTAAPAAPAALATLYEAVGQLLFVAGRYDEALAAYQRMATVARLSGDDRLWVLAAGHSVNLLQMLGRLGEALQLGLETLPLAEAVGDQDTVRRTHLDLAYLHALRGDIAAAQRYVVIAVAASIPLGAPGESAFALTVRGWIAILSGDWRDARADLDQALALGHQVAGLVVLAYVQSVQARLSLAEGDGVAATAAARQAYGLAETSGDMQALRWAAPVLAELDLVASRPEAAVARLEPLCDPPGREDYDVTALLPALACAYLELDRLDEASATVDQALARARREEMRLVLVDALRVQAMIALRQGRWVEAAASLKEGIELARCMPYPYAEVRLLRLEAALHTATGKPELARERLDAATAIASTLITAVGAMERADAALLIRAR